MTFCQIHSFIWATGKQAKKVLRIFVFLRRFLNSIQTDFLVLLPLVFILFFKSNINLLPSSRGLYCTQMCMYKNILSYTLLMFQVWNWIKLPNLHGLQRAPNNWPVLTDFSDHITLGIKLPYKTYMVTFGG